jgi:hypothetical protein
VVVVVFFWKVEMLGKSGTANKKEGEREASKRRGFWEVEVGVVLEKSGKARRRERILILRPREKSGSLPFSVPDDNQPPQDASSSRFSHLFSLSLQPIDKKKSDRAISCRNSREHARPRGQGIGGDGTTTMTERSAILPSNK